MAKKSIRKWCAINQTAHQTTDVFKNNFKYKRSKVKHFQFKELRDQPTTLNEGGTEDIIVLGYLTKKLKFASR